MPEDYVAILGDSHAHGTGEWQNRVINQNQPDYHAGHILHKSDDIDVVTWGMPGASNITSLVLLPDQHLNNIRNYYHYPIQDPKFIIAYFYEGNDLTDNLEHLQTAFMNKVFDPEKPLADHSFQEWLAQEANKNILDSSFNNSLIQSHILAHFFLATAASIIHNGFNRSELSPPQAYGNINKIHLSGGISSLSDNMENMGLSLSEERFELGLFSFEQSIVFLKNRFPNSRIGIVYIPSGLSSYRLATEVVSTSYQGNTTKFPADRVALISNRTCEEVRRIAATHHLGFVDFRERIRQTTNTSLVHDPRDWLHFNQAGYTALGEELSVLLHQLQTGVANVPMCAPL